MQIVERSLYGMAKNMGVPSMWLDDAVQEARIALWRKDSAYPKTQMWNAMVDFLRSAVHDSRSGEKPDVCDIAPLTFLRARESVVDELIDAEMRLAALSDRERRVLLLRAYGYSLVEIARTEGCNNTRICQIVKKAQKALAA